MASPTRDVVRLLVILLAAAPPAWACGGFFCQQVPIDQAGEQIIFRQDGDQITAIVLILYEGTAEDFSWVVPVPGVPELSTGSDVVFNLLEPATRPQFVLETVGSPCFFDDATPVFPLALAPPAAPPFGDSGVEILEELTVGPFEIQVVSSDDPDAMAAWLEDNDYDLTDRGRELIAPYVEDGMNFVALRLRQDAGVGDIQPLVMKYTSEDPMIPIRLTAVAAQPDMGVIVWLLGPARAVPLNYLHVIPNYTLVNWYFGTNTAYATYQNLVTAAMNEAGGQGFATDYAGRDFDPTTVLPTVAEANDELDALATIESDFEFISRLWGSFFFAIPSDKIQAAVRRHLPLPAGVDEFVYFAPDVLAEAVTADEAATARPAILAELVATVIDPLEETLTVFDGDLYLTRLYTTLSPEEMTLDPTFSFNPDLDDQPFERNATLAVDCVAGSTEWTLTLGPGTDRDGELVIEGTGLPPAFSTAPTIDQESAWRTETVGKSGPAQVVTQRSFTVAQTTSDEAIPPLLALCGAGVGQCGAGAAGMLLATMLMLRLIPGRRSR